MDDLCQEPGGPTENRSVWTPPYPSVGQKRAGGALVEPATKTTARGRDDSVDEVLEQINEILHECESSEQIDETPHERSDTFLQRGGDTFLHCGGPRAAPPAGPARLPDMFEATYAVAPGDFALPRTVTDSDTESDTESDSEPLVLDLVDGELVEV